MSNTIDPNVVTLDDMNYFWMENGAPCFIANNWDVVDDICETIESFGFQIYYLICDKSTAKTIQVKNEKGVMTPKEVYEYSPAILKVVNNFTGRVVMDSPDPLGNNFASVPEVAEYSMPLIPKIIIDKLDEFFRLIEAQHNTESIVILTYDTTKEGSDGWGVLVPDQQNTSVHCKYDADSIAALKPDNVMIVGSVHSHPSMAAYASGTDHADQADFDGIHITYGWQKSVNNNATQYHIELQIGGSSFVLKPEDVFESYSINKDPDPEVIEWSSKVKKALPLYTGGFTATGPAKTHLTNTTQQTTQTHSYPHTPPGIKAFDKSKFLGDINAIDPDAVVAIEYSMHNEHVDCLMCAFPITDLDVNSGYCMTCGTPMVSTTMNYSEIIEFLTSYCIGNKIDPNVPFYMYCDDTGSGNFLINIKPRNQDPNKLVESHNNNSSYTSYYGSAGEFDEEEISVSYTLCCDIPCAIIEQCTCPVTVTEDNIYHFDKAHQKLDIYDSSSDCLNCAHYYQVTCPLFKKAIVDYMTNDNLVSEKFTRCNSFLDYKNVPVDSYYGAMYD